MQQTVARRGVMCGAVKESFVLWFCRFIVRLKCMVDRQTNRNMCICWGRVFSSPLPYCNTNCHEWRRVQGQIPIYPSNSVDQNYTEGLDPTTHSSRRVQISIVRVNPRHILHSPRGTRALKCRPLCACGVFVFGLRSLKNLHSRLYQTQ